MDVIVIGGGISGLSLAHSLGMRVRKAGAEIDVTVLEALDRSGGHAWTVRDDGFTVEAGPNGFLNREPGPEELAAELGMDGDLIEARPEAKRRFILNGGRLRAVPESPPTLFTSDALSPWGKVRLLMEPWARRAPQDVEETVYEFATRRVGAEAAENLVDAAISGISAGNSRDLSVSAAFPLMTELERDYGGLIRGMMARRGQRAKIMTFKGGLGALVDGLVAHLGEKVETGARVASVRPAEGRWRVTLADGQQRIADHVVFATPAHRTARMLADLDPELGGLLDETPYAGLSLVALAYKVSDVPRSLAGYGYLVTRSEKLKTLGVVWESSLFDDRAPEGTALLRAFVGGARHPDSVKQTESEVEAVARRELQGVLGVSADPVRSWVFRWPQAIAQYTLGHVERVKRARALVAKHPGLHLAGTAYDGISFSVAITAARRYATRLADELLTERPSIESPYEVVGAAASSGPGGAVRAQEQR